MDTRASDRIADEQAALRRVAVLVARGAPPEEIFAAVTAEAGRLLDADLTTVGRYEPDGVVTLGAWSSTGVAVPFPVGTRTSLGGQNVITLVFQSGRPVRMDDYGGATGEGAGVGHDWGFRGAVGAPIRVEGRLWGVMTVGSTRGEFLPADAEARLTGFTELVGSAIANAQARVDLRAYAEEQAALRRVATLVAAGASPEEMFAAVAAEIGRVVATEFTSVSRYYADDTATIVGVWTRTGTIELPSVGDRLSLGGQNMTTLVHQTGQPARIDDYYSEASGSFADIARGWGARSAVGVPIRVGGRLWGVVNVWSPRKAALPADTEARLAGFTELVGTAIANAEAQAALAASRARIAAAADEARRRIERDLHDGAQQRLVTLTLRLREARRIGPYRLIRELGRGGMGRVFLARSAGGRPVAVKVIRGDLAADPEFRARFRHEVAAARKVNGLYTALVVDADVDGPMPWLATAYVAGPSLADIVRRQGPLPAGSVAVLAAGLAEGLGAIHAAGLVHRDLKPPNVLLADDGPRVIDFGISWAAEASSLTSTGLVVGSPGFMSPEQAEGREVGPPSDVFSLGAVLTFACTGHGPFGTGAAPALGYRVVHALPDLADVPAGIRSLVGRCLAKDPGQRPGVAELLAELGDPDLPADWLSYRPPAPQALGAPVTVAASAHTARRTGAAPRRRPLILPLD